MNIFHCLFVSSIAYCNILDKPLLRDSGEEAKSKSKSEVHSLAFEVNPFGKLLI